MVIKFDPIVRGYHLLLLVHVHVRLLLELGLRELILRILLTRLDAIHLLGSHLVLLHLLLLHPLEAILAFVSSSALLIGAYWIRLHVDGDDESGKCVTAHDSPIVHNILRGHLAFKQKQTG